MDKTIRNDFPQLKFVDHYLDTASTALKPQCVIDATNIFYSQEYASAGRGSYDLAANADILVEKTRKKVREFVSISDAECIFTSGATAALNMAAQMVGAIVKSKITKTKNKVNFVLTTAEHHSNIIPWQQLSSSLNKMGYISELRYLECDATGALKLDTLKYLIDDETAAIAITAASNVTGKITDLEQLRISLQKFDEKYSNDLRPLVILDACQLLPHQRFRCKIFEPDFIVFSAHKLYGPSGIGALIAKNKILNSVSPYDAMTNTGGGIVELVEKNHSTFQKAPQKFEPGTLNMAGIAGLYAALKWIDNIGMDNVFKNERKLAKILWDQLSQIDEVNLLGKYPDNPNFQLGLAVFGVNSIHPHDLGQYLNQKGVQVRVGHHCAQLIHRHFSIPSSTRASLGIYSNEDDIFELVLAIKDAIHFFKR